MTTAGQRLQILIAEDNNADVLLIKEALKEHGLEYRAEVASDGDQAFAFLHRLSAGSEMTPDLILLDLNLRTHHGTEILAKIRNMPELKQVPVVVLTSSDSPKDREQVKKLGANLYIRKPMDLAAFLRIGEQIAAVLNEP
jgi:chemotaxis family two-component system response regulator Rcp1